MAKEELNDQLNSYEGYINGIPLVIDPCRQCRFVDQNKTTHYDNVETCRMCCWFYDSKFEVGN